MRTVLADGGRAGDDDGGLACGLGRVAFLPGCGEGDGVSGRVVVPEAGDDGREPEGYARGLVEGEVLRDLRVGGERELVGTCAGPVIKWMERRRTLAARSAGKVTNCWKVARSLVKKPWNRLGGRFGQQELRSREEAVHLVALGPFGDFGTDLLDDARGVRAGDEGVFLDEHPEFPDLPVDGVQRRRRDLDEKLIGAGLRNSDLGDLPLALLLGEDESLLGSHSVVSGSGGKGSRRGV